ncbi:MAG: hypothetical protein C0624_07115 [Desulfuromonas sp.]|nr:MAG: hypothetical protein C0624_07115 [Desulfuromonas sp.]
MSILIGILVALIYLVLFVDWKEMSEVLKQGGWAAVAVYVVVGIFVASALGGEAVHQTGMHH